MSEAPLTRRELRELERRRERGEQVAPQLAPTVAVESSGDELGPSASERTESAAPLEGTAPSAVDAPAEVPSPTEIAGPSGETAPAGEAASGVALEAPITPTTSSRGGVAFNRSPAALEQESRDDAASGDYFRRLVMASHSSDETPTGMIVMPEMSSPDITGALTEAGDLMVTGKMQVSRELSNFGTLTRGLDSPQLDREDDVDDPVGGEHAPISASRAVREPGMPLAPRRGHGVRLSIWAVVGGLAVALAGVVAVILGIVQGWF